MQTPPSAKEIKTAAGQRGVDAIPYPDLRATAKRAYEKQLSACKNYACDALKTGNEVAAASERAKICREHRIGVRTIFAQAIARVKGVLQKMTHGDPLKPDLTTILQKLEASQKGHETAIDEVNKAHLKCEEKLKKLAGK